MISDNLYSLRKLHQLTQEEVSERVGVSRQALAKWENGETMPDIEKCVLLAELYNVTLDDLVNYTKDELGLSVPPKGKHVFGVVTVGDKDKTGKVKQYCIAWAETTGYPLHIIEDAAHFSNGDNAEQVNSEIEQFVIQTTVG